MITIANYRNGIEHITNQLWDLTIEHIALTFVHAFTEITYLNKYIFPLFNTLITVRTHFSLGI